MSRHVPLDASAVNTYEGAPSYSLRDRIGRMVWNVVWAVFARWSPVELHVWRRVILRAFGAKIHKTAKVYPSTQVWLPSNLVMEQFSCLAGDVICYCMAPIHVGEYCTVSQRSTLCAGTHDIRDPNFQLKTKPIKLGARCWVAAEAFVGPGVTIGDGAVVGARGVVMRDVAPWTVVAGNPANVVGPRELRPA